MDQVLPYVLAVVPSIGVGFLFYIVIKAIIEGDRNERLAQSRWEAGQGPERDTQDSPPQGARNVVDPAAQGAPPSPHEHVGPSADVPQRPRA